MVSLDVKILFTNVPMDGAMDAVKRALYNISDSDLPIERGLCEISVVMCTFWCSPSRTRNMCIGILVERIELISLHFIPHLRVS